MCFGVGCDNVNVEACTCNDVMLAITPDGVSAIALLMALSHKLLIKDRLTREMRWNEKPDHMGVGLTERTFGLIGLGNIGREIIKMASVLDIGHLAYDLFFSQSDVAKLVGLEELLKESDFVCSCCALTEDRHHLLNAERLGKIKPNGAWTTLSRLLQSRASMSFGVAILIILNSKTR
jgi:phosphoglycerate dehydrogenase-like enzyme